MIMNFLSAKSPAAARTPADAQFRRIDEKAMGRTKEPLS
jgi:hypothetical protein